MRSVLWVVAGIAIAGCSDKKPAEKLYDGPMPVTFGDCAGADVAWVSGPRPLPFKPADAENAWVAADGSSLAPTEAPAAPPPPPPVTAPADPEVARKAAIEVARSAGVLGSVSLAQGGAFESLPGTDDVAGEPDDDASYGGLLGTEVGETGFRGLGMTGTGPQNGGPSYGSLGTIGTGRYGTIGHGSGTGEGYSPGGGYVWQQAHGGMRGRSAAPPTHVTIGDPYAIGDLDKGSIRRSLKLARSRISYCYEKQLLVQPRLAGKITAKFFIGPNGNVLSVEVAGMRDPVSSCVAGMIKAIEFPKPKGGGGVQVTLPLTFTPEDPNNPPGSGRRWTPPAERPAPQPTKSTAGNAATTATASGAGGAGSAGSNAGSGDAGIGAAGSADADRAVAATNKRRLFRATDLQAAAYQPGTLNPVRPERAAVEHCLRKGATHAGTAVFELAYDANGAVQHATIHGVADENVEACLVAVAKKVKSVGATGAERCSISYGEMPMTSLPALEISADAITLGTAKLTTTEAVLAEQLPGRVKAITDALDAQMKAVTAANGPVLSQHGPIVIKPVDTTKMKVVTRTIASVLASGNDFVLATTAGAEWSLLTPLSLPIVPVPFGTGGTWNNVKVPRVMSHAPADARPMLSIYIGKNTIALARTKPDGSVSFPRDASAPKALGDELKKRKAMPELASRDDIEIAIDNDLTYADYIAVVRTAIAAGFQRWRFTEPRSLLATPQL